MPNHDFNWLDYIIKLNDRELNRRRASGFTLWALLGAVALLFVQVFDRLSLIWSSPLGLYLFITLSAAVANLSVCLLILFMPPIILQYAAQDRRMTSIVNKRTSQLATYYLLFLLTLMSVFNFYSAITAYDRYLYAWPFYVFGFFCIVQVVFPWINTKIITRSVESKGLTIPEISSGPFGSEKLRKILVPIILILGCLLLFTCIFSFYDLFSAHYIMSNFELMKISLRFVILLILILVLLREYGKKLKFDWLENLERRIIIEDLNAEQIKLLFVQEFLGIKTVDWINSIQEELAVKADQFFRVLEKAQQELTSIGGINKDFKFEIDGRKKATCDKVNEAYLGYYEYSLGKVEQIQMLFNQSPLNSDEALALKAIMGEWKNQTNEVKTKHDNFCNSCKAIKCEKLETTSKEDTQQ